MKHKQNLSLRILIVVLMLSTLACQALSFGKPDLEATIQAGMEETRTAEESDAEPEVIAPAKSGETISSGEVEIFISPEFQDEQPEISAEAISETLAPAPEESTSVGQAYEITSDGDLNGPVLITISYDPAELDPGVSEENLYIATLVGDQWQVVPDGYVDTINKTVSVAVEHFSFFGIFQSAAQVVYDAVQAAVGDEITSEYFGDLPQQIRYEFYDLEIKPQDVTAVVHAKLSLATKTASGLISFGNLVSKTAGLAISAIEGVEDLAWAMGELVFAEIGDYATNSTGGSFIVTCYDSFDLGREIGKTVYKLKDANPGKTAAMASAWILAREMEYINENLDPAFEGLWKKNTLSASRLDVYAVYFDAVPWKEALGLGASGVKFYYFDDSKDEWVNYYNDVFVWKMVFEADKDQAVAQAEPSGTPQPTATTRPSYTPKPTNPPAPSSTTLPSATAPRPTSGEIFVFPDGSGDYTTIKEAIYAVEPGTTIYLDSGVYIIEEEIVIEKTISIIGIREDLTEINFPNHYESFVFKGPGTLTIEDVTMHGDVYFAVHAEGGEIVIRNSRFSGSSHHPIKMSNNSTGTIQGSEISSHFDGSWTCIALHDNASLVVEDNYINDCDVGINFEDNASATVQFNSIQNTHYGINMEDYSQATIENNFVTDNFQYGINVTHYSSAIIRGNDCSRNGGDGIWAGWEADVTIVDNICNDNGYAGIYTNYDNSGTIDGNECGRNKVHGIVVGGPNLYIGSNNCYDSGEDDMWGMGYGDD